MHLTVGYLATSTGDDGVALASARQDLRCRCRRRPRCAARISGRPSRSSGVPETAHRAWRGMDLPGDRPAHRQRCQRVVHRVGRRVVRRIARRLCRTEGFGPHRGRRRARRILRRPYHRTGNRRPAALLADSGGAGTARIRRRPRRGLRRRDCRGADSSRRRQPAAVRDHPRQRRRTGHPDAVAGVGREPRRSRQRTRGAPAPGGRRRGESRGRGAGASGRARDRIACRRRHDAGVRAEKAPVGRRRPARRRFQQVRRTAADLPGVDGRAHPGRRRRPGDRYPAQFEAEQTRRKCAFSPACRGSLRLLAQTTAS